MYVLGESARIHASEGVVDAYIYMLANKDRQSSDNLLSQVFLFGGQIRRNEHEVDRRQKRVDELKRRLSAVHSV